MTLDKFVSTYTTSQDQLMTIKEVLMEDAENFAGFLDAFEASKAPWYSYDAMYGFVINMLGLGPAYDVAYFYEKQKKSLTEAKRATSTLIQFIETEQPKIREYKEECLEVLAEAEDYQEEINNIIENMPALLPVPERICARAQHALDEMEHDTMAKQILVTRYQLKKDMNTADYKQYKNIDRVLHVVYLSTVLANDYIKHILRFMDNTYEAHRIFERVNNSHEQVAQAFDKLKEYRIEMYKVVNEAVRRSQSLALQIP